MKTEEKLPDIGWAPASLKLHEGGGAGTGLQKRGQDKRHLSDRRLEPG